MVTLDELAISAPKIFTVIPLVNPVAVTVWVQLHLLVTKLLVNVLVEITSKAEDVISVSNLISITQYVKFAAAMFEVLSIEIRPPVQPLSTTVNVLVKTTFPA